MKKKNVLFIFTDQQRRDTIHALGNDEIVTPALDSIAEEAVVFDRCYTPSPVCVPARLCMMAGQYCNRTGNNNNTDDAVYDGSGFYQKFTDAGYNTCCVGKMHHKLDLYGPMGFRKRYTQEEMASPLDDYRSWLRTTPYNHVYDFCGQRTEMYYVPQVSQLPMEAHPTQWVGDRCVDFLRNAPAEEPIFLVASFIHPHPPFAPPAPWNKMYRKPIRRAFVPEDRDSYADLLRNKYTCGAFGISPRRLELLNQHYYACISFVDYQISRLIDVLKERGMYDDTILVFSSDHGELMGDYESMGKRTMLDAASNIPFMIRMPGKDPEIRHDPASLVDLAPTLLSACGIAYDPEEYDGIDLFRGSHDLIFSQYANGDIGSWMAASGWDKLVYSAIGDRYFYFDSFPDAKDKYDPENPRCAFLKEKLDEYRRSDRCPVAARKPDAQSPLRQEKYSFYPPFDDHGATAEEEAARMPEGYPITIGYKRSDF